jgi:tetratricopeptide (TPR) repeat protein
LRLVLLAFCRDPHSYQYFAAPPGESNLQQIATLIEQGQYREAEAMLQQAVKSDPTSPPVHRLLGILYQREEKLAQAEEALEKAVKLSGGRDPQTLFLLCQTKFALKKTREALGLAAQASVLAGNEPQAHYALGRLLRENGQVVEAVRELEKARSLAPQNPAVTTELIIAYQQQGRTAQAEERLQPFLKTASHDDLVQAGSRFGEAGQFAVAARAFERALVLRPNSYDAQFDLAFAHYHQGNYPKALEILDRIGASRSGGLPDYHYLRGKVELALQRVQAAGEQFLLPLQKQPGNESLCMDAGLLFSRSENLWKALEVFQSCARRLPDSVAIETGLGLTYFRLGKYSDAVEAFKKVLTVRPEADAAREALVFPLYISGNLGEARRVLEQRIGGGDVDYYIYFLHALVLLRQDARAHRALALRSLHEALRRNPDFAPAYFQRGKIAFETGDPVQALADLETAVRLEPTYAQPYYVMPQIYFKQGEREKAEQARLKFTALNREQEEKEQKRWVENRLFQALQ